MDRTEDNPDASGAGREADQRLIHALLLHLHDDQAAENREQRVQRAMQAIRETAALQTPSASAPAVVRPERTHRLPGWFRRGAWAAAATVLLAIGLWVFTYAPKPAMASLNDIISALGHPGDRTYRIRMEDLPEPPQREPRNDPPPEAVPKPGLDGATLYLRDGQQYLLVRKDPNGGSIFDGYDGRQSWRVRAGVLAETKEGLGAGGIPMPAIMADVPFSDLHRTLEQIKTDYTVEQLDQAPLPSGGEVLRHVLVRRNSREVRGPETIELWADPKTAIPQRIVFDRAKVQGNREPCRLTFDLVSQELLFPNWFTPAPHISTSQ